MNFQNFFTEPVGAVGRPLKRLFSPTSKVTTQLYEIWLDKKCALGLPLREQFSPMEMKDILPFVYMIDVLDDGADFRIRLLGTALVQLLGGDYTGLKLSAARDVDAWRSDIYREVYETKQPIFYQFDLGDLGKRHMKTENVLLPLRDKNHEFTILLGASEIIDYDYSSSEFGVLP
jgi:hypothetical protein